MTIFKQVIILVRFTLTPLFLQESTDKLSHFCVVINSRKSKRSLVFTIPWFFVLNFVQQKKAGFKMAFLGS